MKKFNIKFYENRKIYFGITIALLVVGVIFNIIFGTTLDVQFKGGAMLDYSFSGEIDTGEVESIVEEVTGQNVDVGVYSSMVDTNGASSSGLSITFAGTDSITVDEQNAITSAILEKYPDSGLVIEETTSVDRTVGTTFFAKCLVAVAITFVLLVIYIAFRFRKIGGASAGIISIIALLHDVILVYFTFVVFRMPINDNFIAVILTILGYSLNNTIIIYDRMRENQRLYSDLSRTVLVNRSIGETLSRTINTTLTTIAAVAVICVVAVVCHVESILSFSFPLLIGMISGTYSTIFVACPLWTIWQDHKAKRQPKRKAVTSTR